MAETEVNQRPVAQKVFRRKRSLTLIDQTERADRLGVVKYNAVCSRRRAVHKKGQPRADPDARGQDSQADNR